MITEGAKVASFAGAPAADVVKRLNDAGLVTMVTVGAKRHAEKMVKMGVAALIAQGGEGGGHTGATPTSLLLPAVVDATEGSGVPVLGAGGYYDGRGLVAALAYGAQGIAMGTRFLLTQESHVPDHVKAIYVGTPVTGTVVTTAIDGAPQRVIRTEMIDALEKAPTAVRFPRAALNAVRFARASGTPLLDLARTGLAMRKAQELTWAQVALAANAPMMTKAGVVDGRVDAGILPTGQVVGSIDELPTAAEVVATIMAEAEATLARLS
jgi:NAD(P)H-dependent flavin oxidoreductase YrpB (nitropropane dioxygenase family)